MPIMFRFCRFFYLLFDFNLVLVVFISFIVYRLKMSLKISRMYFLCYLVIFNIKKFAFLINSVLLCAVIVVIPFCPYVLQDVTILQLSLL